VDNWIHTHVLHRLAQLSNIDGQMASNTFRKKLAEYER